MSYETIGSISNATTNVRWNHGKSAHNDCDEYTNLNLYVPQIMQTYNTFIHTPLIVYFTGAMEYQYFDLLPKQQRQNGTVQYLLQNCFILSVTLHNVSSKYKKSVHGYPMDYFTELKTYIENKFPKRQILYQGFSKGASQLLELVIRDRTLFKGQPLYLGAPYLQRKEEFDPYLYGTFQKIKPDIETDLNNQVFYMKFVYSSQDEHGKTVIPTVKVMSPNFVMQMEGKHDKFGKQFLYGPAKEDETGEIVDQIQQLMTRAKLVQAAAVQNDAATVNTEEDAEI